MNPCQRDLEPGICPDLSGEKSYGDYLRLGQLLSAQAPVADPPVHDEFLFIGYHQICELWLRLLIHELRAARVAIVDDDLHPCMRAIARCRQMLEQLTGMWPVLESMLPTEFARFRSILGQASGLQSHQYRTLEFLLGTKHPAQAQAFRHDAVAYAAIQRDLNAPSMWDEVLRLLKRRGFAIPRSQLERDFSLPYEPCAEVCAIIKRIYTQASEQQDLVDLFEGLVDVEQEFQAWRFRHLRAVTRFIGVRRGTGGSSGSPFLKKSLDLTFFPELFQVRSEF